MFSIIYYILCESTGLILVFPCILTLWFLGGLHHLEYDCFVIFGLRSSKIQMQTASLFHSLSRAVGFCKDTELQKPFFFMHIFLYTFSSFFMYCEATQMILGYIVKNETVESPLIRFINKLTLDWILYTQFFSITCSIFCWKFPFFSFVSEKVESLWIFINVLAGEFIRESYIGGKWMQNPAISFYVWFLWVHSEGNLELIYFCLPITIFHFAYANVSSVIAAFKRILLL